MWRINAHKERIGFLSSVIGSLASGLGLIIALLSSYGEITWWVIALIILFVGMGILASAIVIRSGTTTRVYRADDELGIRKYMLSWIRNGGRVAIWTRDMSWADDDDVKQLLAEKAESQELIICLPRETANTDYLKQKGAEVIAYGAWDSPTASFTIANYNRSGSRVAVGRRDGSMHVIQEFSTREHPLFDLAHDMVRLVRENKLSGL